jgi:hypothetical protein
MRLAADHDEARMTPVEWSRVMRQQRRTNSKHNQTTSRQERVVSIWQVAEDLQVDDRMLRWLLRYLYPDHVLGSPWRWRESEAREVKRRVERALGRRS